MDGCLHCEWMARGYPIMVNMEQHAKEHVRLARPVGVMDHAAHRSHHLMAVYAAELYGGPGDGDRLMVPVPIPIRIEATTLDLPGLAQLNDPDNDDPTITPLTTSTYRLFAVTAEKAHYQYVQYVTPNDDDKN